MKIIVYSVVALFLLVAVVVYAMAKIRGQGVCTGFTFLGKGVIVRLDPGGYFPSIRIRDKAEVMAEIRTLRGF